MRMVRAAAAALALFLPAHAFAQTASDATPPAQAPPAKPAPTPAAATVKQVTVTADTSRTARKIDRQVYRPGSNLQSSSGSASDVLKDVPSVEVDSDGNVTIRGDPNVTILVDGKPSAQMNADRAAALENLPADQIDRIEVSDTPSADQKADGSGGVINIVTKKGRGAGVSGSAAVSLGDQGRKNASFSASRRAGKLTLYGGLSVRHDVRKRIYTDQRDSIDATTGAESPSQLFRINEVRRLSPTLSGGAEYAWTKADQLSASFSYNDRFGLWGWREQDLAFDPTDLPTSDMSRDAIGKEHEVNSDYLMKWRHAFSGDHHTLEIALHQTESDEHQRRTYTDVSALPPGPDTLEDMRLHPDELTRELSLDYTRPLPDGAQMKTGYDLERDDDDYDNHDWFRDPTTGVLAVNPALTDHFRYAQSVHALYGTWQRPFGKLTVLAGVRLEQTFIDFDEITTSQTGRIRYFRVHPSLHLEYALGGGQTLRASYSHRIVRPRPEDLNPYPVFQDAFDYSAGNPHLMPQETHSLEAGWTWRHGGSMADILAYWRQTSDAFTTVSQYVAPTVLLTTEENLGQASTGGAELSGSGKLWKGLSYNLDGNLFYTEIDAANLGLPERRSLVTYSAKASLDWKPNASDTFQVSGYASGRRLSADGWRLPTGAVNVGWRRKLTERLSLTATVADVFNTQRDRDVIALPTLHDFYTRRQLGRIFYVGLTRRFGGGKKTDEKFDYSDQSG